MKEDIQQNDVEMEKDFDNTFTDLKTGKIKDIFTQRDLKHFIYKQMRRAYLKGFEENKEAYGKEMYRRGTIETNNSSLYTGEDKIDTNQDPEEWQEDFFMKYSTSLFFCEVSEGQRTYKECVEEIIEFIDSKINEVKQKIIKTEVKYWKEIFEKGLKVSKNDYNIAARNIARIELERWQNRVASCIEKAFKK